jgi:hypothetical protein
MQAVTHTESTLTLPPLGLFLDQRPRTATESARSRVDDGDARRKAGFSLSQRSGAQSLQPSALTFHADEDALGRIAGVEQLPEPQVETADLLDSLLNSVLQLDQVLDFVRIRSARGVTAP